MLRQREEGPPKQLAAIKFIFCNASTAIADRWMRQLEMLPAILGRNSRILYC
jgi:hypothetical protein